MTLLYVAPEVEPISCLRGIDPKDVAEAPEGTVYLLHFDKRFYPNPGSSYYFAHYIGYARQGRLVARMIEHRNGSGSKFLRKAQRAGTTWHLARVWAGDLKEERRIKTMGGASRSCPSCGIIPDSERQKFRGPNGRYILLPRELS